jgi:hypothetical protein
MGTLNMNFEDIAQIPPYSLDKAAKGKMLTERLKELTEHHRENCEAYDSILDSISYDENAVESYEDLPFLPVRLFKERTLKSVEEDEIVKTMTSSGTSGQNTSKIYLDRTTSSNQQKAMVKIVSDFTGSSRMPMIIIDCPSVVKDRKKFSARGAGILGFSIFGAKKIYALDDEMHLNIAELKEFLSNYSGKRILLFGFTFMIWQHFYKELVRLKEETGETIDLSNAVLIHGGGWKKLVSEAVSPEEFHDRLFEICGLDDIHDYYGMVEQTGCIYMQCECGHLHASIFSDVIIRRHTDFSVADVGEKGIIQVVSTIPESYPGHLLLTEDEGVILGEDDCPCGRKGKYFRIFGRLKNAEIRGCSDTYAVEHGENNIDDNNYNNTLQKITFLTGDNAILSEMPQIPPRQAFDDTTINFLNELSRELMKNPEAKAYADIVSFGFWLRKGSISSLKERFTTEDGNIHVGRGVAFHVAPSNVPVNFAYSLTAGLVTGNANVVRVPSKDFPQVDIICKSINAVLERFPKMKPYICLVRYERDKEINDALSQLCDTRVVWGGDGTIAELRKSPLPPRATEITFADRYSLAVIDSDEYMVSENKDRIASDFFNDTYLTDQNACTSPRVVVWAGNRRDEAKNIFWGKLHGLVEEKYSFQPVMAVDKLTQGYLAATASDEIGHICLSDNNDTDNLLVRVKVEKLTPKLMDYRGNCGFFYEYACKDIMELRDFCDDTHCQTIGVLGNKEILRPLVSSGIKGVDRIAAIGHTMDFDLNWDGYNLVERLTRTVVI